MSMTLTEAMDYIKTIDMDGITLTESGRGAAMIILEKRKSWTPTHELMLMRLQNGMEKLPHKLGRTVNRTRLGDAIELVRKVMRPHIRNQKAKARRKAAKARRMAMEKAAA